MHFFSCVAVFKVGEFCGFPHLRVLVNWVVFRNRLLCRILFSCACIDKATNFFFFTVIHHFLMENVQLLTV